MTALYKKMILKTDILNIMAQVNAAHFKSVIH